MRVWRAPYARRTAGARQVATGQIGAPSNQRGPMSGTSIWQKRRAKVSGKTPRGRGATPLPTRWYRVARKSARIGAYMTDNKNNLLDWLGIQNPPNFLVARWLGSLLGSLLLFFAICLVVIVIVATGHLFRALFTGNHEAIRGVGYLLIAALGAPFLAWRTTLAAKQANLQGQALFNDKINAATEELAARKQVTRVIENEDGNKTVLTEWADDLVRRAAAIDRLEGLAQEKPDEAIRIARLLSVYVKELSREHPAKPVPKDLSPEAMWTWAQNLKVERPDMERAVQSLSRLNTQIRRQSNDPSTKVVDLRNTNLQGFNLGGLDLQNADLSGAQMQRAQLSNAKMRGATLVGAKMEVAQMSSAGFEHANFSFAHMQGADLSGAAIQAARLRNTKMDSWTRLGGVSFRGAGLQWSQYKLINVEQETINQAFGDASVELPSTISRPNWPDVNLRYSEFETEWQAWQALGPDGYNWEDRRKYYTDEGRFSDLGRPPKAQGNWMAEDDG